MIQGANVTEFMNLIFFYQQSCDIEKSFVTLNIYMYISNANITFFDVVGAKASALITDLVTIKVLIAQLFQLPNQHHKFFRAAIFFTTLR